MSRTILDDLTRALFAHLRGGNACFDEENELIGLLRRCPRCSRNLRPLVLDTFTDNKDGKQYERMWWTCPGIESKDCFFPLDIPKEVFWTRRTMEQSVRGIHPLPNLHLLPRSMHALYPRLFNTGINLEQLVHLSSLVPPSDASTENVLIRSANSAFKTPHQHGVPQREKCVDVGGASRPSLPPDTLPPKPSTVCCRISVHRFLTSPQPVQSQRPAVVHLVSPNNSAVVDPQLTVHAFFKQAIRDRIFCREAAHGDREHRKSIDLHPNANAALNSHLLLNLTGGDPKRIVNSLNAAVPPTVHRLRQRQQPSTPPRYLTQQQHVRLKGMLRSLKTKMNAGRTRAATEGVMEEEAPHGQQQQRVPRYLFALTERQRAKRKEATRHGETTKQHSDDNGAKQADDNDGANQRKRIFDMDVLAALNSVQKELVSKELMDRFYGVQRPLSTTPPVGTTTNSSRKPSNSRGSRQQLPAGGDPFRLMPLTNGQSSLTGTSITNSMANSSVSSDSSSLGHRLKRGRSIGRTLPAAVSVGDDPALTEKITRNYESIFLKALEQVNTSRRSVTPSALSSQIVRSVSPSSRLDHFDIADEVAAAMCSEGAMLGGIPHDFDRYSAPQQYHDDHLFAAGAPFSSLEAPVAIRPSNQLMPINYAEGEELSMRFMQNDALEVTQLSQQMQMSSNLTLEEEMPPEYDSYLGFGLEEEGDPTALDMTPMMPAEEAAADERAFLRAQMGMLP